MDDEAIWLSDKEDQVYKLLVSGMRASDISKTTSIRTSSLHSIIKRLLNLRLLEKQKKEKGSNLEYRSLALAYNVMHDRDLFKLRMKTTYHTRRQGIEPFAEIILNETQMVFLRQHYDWNRSDLAKVMGIPRYVLCRELIKLQLSEET